MFPRQCHWSKHVHVQHSDPTLGHTRYSCFSSVPHSASCSSSLQLLEGNNWCFLSTFSTFNKCSSQVTFDICEELGTMPSSDGNKPYEVSCELFGSLKFIICRKRKKTFSIEITLCGMWLLNSQLYYCFDSIVN